VKTSLQTVDTSNSQLEADLKEPTAAIEKADAELINLRQVVEELDDEIKVNTEQKAQLKL
jgi:septal ring factor EnvC (AmiA/AmiB activator)